MKWIPIAVLAAACSSSESPENPQPPPREVQAVYYLPGAAWDVSKPAEEQALGPHLDFVGQEVAANRLVANGLFTTSPRGLYLVSGDSAAADAFVAADPALASHLLAHDATENWALAIDVEGQLEPNDVAFVLRYRPGPSWVSGKPLAEQALGPHLDYIANQVRAGAVILGGPIDGGETGGMYLVRAASLDVAQNIATSDPGVAAGIFAPAIDGWRLMNAPN